MVEAGLGVEFAQGGDDQRLRRPLCLQVGPVRWHWFRIRQRANLGLWLDIGSDHCEDGGKGNTLLDFRVVVQLLVENILSMSGNY